MILLPEKLPYDNLEKNIDFDWHYAWGYNCALAEISRLNEGRVVTEETLLKLIDTLPIEYTVRNEVATAIVEYLRQNKEVVKVPEKQELLHKNCQCEACLMDKGFNFCHDLFTAALDKAGVAYE